MVTTGSQTENPAGSPRVVDKTPPPQPSQDKPDEFDSFEDLTRRLLQVPKKELDALRKKKR